MTEEVLRYDKMVEFALRDVVRSALSYAADNGLPGDHHFYITFETGAPGVDLHESLREQYPEEMTIVLQHQFWDLGVGSDTFKVKLSFNNVPRTLTIPFSAVTAFFDPSVQFGLKFQAAEGAESAAPETSAAANADAPGEETPAEEPEPASDDDGRTADVITLDAFRKK